MFRLDVLQNQWLILALGGGSAILLSVILLFVALWRPRDSSTPADSSPPAEVAELRRAGATPPGQADERLSVFGWFRAYIPWVVILVALGIAAFMIVYVAGAVRRPPNW